MRHTPRLAAALALALLAAGCDAPATAPEAAPPIVSTAEAELQRVARAFALALRDDAVRHSVRDVLRDSPWDEHQVRLQELAATPAGRRLVAAAAAAVGEDAARMQARVDGLPPLDFYVPSREQRLSWRGTAGVTVAASLDPENGKPIGGFDAAGRAIGHALQAGGTVLLLAPAEPRAERSNRQPAGRGDVIQSADDGEALPTFTWIDPSGKRTIVPLAAKAPGSGGGDAGTDNHSGDKTYLDYVKIYFGDGAGDVELQVRADFRAPDGSYLGQGVWSNYSTIANSSQSPHVALLNEVIPDSGTAKVTVAVWEIDTCSGCGGGADDIYGLRDFFWGDRAQTRTAYYGGVQGADIELDWTARAKSVFTGVKVYDLIFNEGTSATTSATATDQYGYPISGYTVSSWSIDAPFVASISSTSGNNATIYGNNDGWGTLYATINGVTGNGNIEVLCVEGRNGMVCPY
jgi:hypothetical protein